MKNSPSPTGEPQLNQLPHARQFLWVSSYQSLPISSCSCFVIFDIVRLLLIVNKSPQNVEAVPVNELFPGVGLAVVADLCAD